MTELKRLQREASEIIYILYCAEKRPKINLEEWK